MENFIISKSNINDLNAFRKVSIDTFIEAYQKQNSKADIDFYVNKFFSIEMIAEELNDESRVIYIAKNENEISGYIKLAIKPIPACVSIKNALEISRIYVRQNKYGTGLAQLLLRKAVEYCRSNQIEALFLAVFQENERAIAFYKKCGFEICGQTTFDWGTGKIDQDWWMVLEIWVLRYEYWDLRYTKVGFKIKYNRLFLTSHISYLKSKA